MLRRILFVITDLEIGGTPTVVRELALRLRASNVHTEVVSLKTVGPVGERLMGQGVAVSAMGATNPLSLSRVVRQLKRVIVDHNIDTVVSFLVHANAVASLAAPDDVRLFQSIQTTQLRPAWHWWLQSWMAARAERFVVPSESVAEFAFEKSGISLDRFDVIPNAIDPKDFEMSRRTAAAGDFRVGFLGRLDPIKRVPDLVEAMKILPASVTLHIFGEGPDRRRIESTITSLGLNDRVTLHGVSAKPQAALQQMDLLVLPSEAEGFGLVLIEAMAAGVPVVATDAIGFRDLEKESLVPVGDPSALAAAIERLIDDPALRDRVIAAGLRTVARNYTWDAVLPKYRRLLGIES